LGICYGGSADAYWVRLGSYDERGVQG